MQAISFKNKTLPINRIATKNDLYSITYNIFTVEGCQNLTARARRYLHFFISLVKLGYTNVSATCPEIANAIFRAQGQTKSVRTLQYALAELEQHGFILRRTCRIGDNNFKTIILIKRDKFAFWTREKTEKVIPLPTSNHISPYAQNQQRVNGTNTQSRVNSEDPYLSDNILPRTHTRCKTRAKRFNFHPIIYTLMLCLKKSPDKFQLLTVAKSEIAGETNLTGIRWQHWSECWQTLPVVEREGIARTEILPTLKTAVGLCPLGCSMPYQANSSDIPDGLLSFHSQKVESREKVAIIVSGLLKDWKKQNPVEPLEDKKINNDTKNLLTKDELSILTRAKHTAYNSW